jgi:hypothetical protein
MDVAIVIVNWNGRELLDACLRSIAATAGNLSYEIIVVDNGSTDGSVNLLRSDFPNVWVIEPGRNLGFGGANNFGMRAILERYGDNSTRPEFMLLLNPDTIVQSDALQALVDCMRKQPHIGVAGAQLLNPDRSFQASYVEFPTLKQEFMILSGLGRKLHGEAFPSAGPAESQCARDDVDYVIGACMLVRTSALQDVGMFDEGFFMYSEEVDWCYRFQSAGWAVGYVPEAIIIHIGGGSTRKARPQMLAELYRSRVRFFEKHYGFTAALGLRGLLLLMNATKLLRIALRRNPNGAPPLSWSLLRHALSSGSAATNTHQHSRGHSL